jgi:hypothetical protein
MATSRTNLQQVALSPLLNVLFRRPGLFCSPLAVYLPQSLEFLVCVSLCHHCILSWTPTSSRSLMQSSQSIIHFALARTSKRQSQSQRLTLFQRPHKALYQGAKHLHTPLLYNLMEQSRLKTYTSESGRVCLHFPAFPIRFRALAQSCMFAVMLVSPYTEVSTRKGH